MKLSQEQKEHDIKSIFLHFKGLSIVRNCIRTPEWAFKGVLIELHERNFMHTKTSLRAHCMHICHCVCNLSSSADINTT